MTVEPPPDFREEVDIVRIDPLFLERQRNRYASRGVAFLVILNESLPSYCSPISLASVRKLRTRRRWPTPWCCSALVWQRLLRACWLVTKDMAKAKGTRWRFSSPGHVATRLCSYLLGFDLGRHIALDHST